MNPAKEYHDLLSRRAFLGHVPVQTDVLVLQVAPIKSLPHLVGTSHPLQLVRVIPQIGEASGQGARRRHVEMTRRVR